MVAKVIGRAFALGAVGALSLSPGASADMLGVPALVVHDFTGRIVAGTGHYAHLRGAVRLRFIPTDRGTQLADAFTLGIDSTPCYRRPRKCITLRGTIAGVVTDTVLDSPSTGTVGYVLSGVGAVHSLGHVTMTGTTRSLRFRIAPDGTQPQERPPLTVILTNRAGRIIITATGPIIPGGFSALTTPPPGAFG